MWQELILVVSTSVDLFTPNALLKTRLEQAVFFSDSRVSLAYHKARTVNSSAWL